MNRLLSSTAAIAICVTMAGCESLGLSSDESAAPQANTQASAQQAPQTSLDGEFAKAHEMRVQGNYDEAAKVLAQLVLFAPTDGRVVGEYGKLLAQQGKSKDAIQFLTQAVSIKGDDWTLYSALGVAYDQVDDRAHARLAYERALALKPGEPAVLNNLAVSRMLAGDYAGAQHYFDETGGSDNPKIAANLAMLSQMRGGKASSALAQTKAKHIAIPAKPQAVASAAPQSLMPKPVQTNDLTSSKPTTVASTQAKEPPTVMMQQVPDDPQAGPVRATQLPRNIVTASTPKTKPAANAPAKAVIAKTATPPKTLALNHAPELRASTDDLRPSPLQQ